MTGPSPGQPADLYQVLGVPADASRAEIARAYRQLARDAHPDTQGADPAAAGRFQQITEAYQILGDPARRARYDRARPRPARRGQDTGSSPGQPQPGQPQAVPIRVRPGRPASRPPIWAGPVHVEPAVLARGDDPPEPPASNRLRGDTLFGTPPVAGLAQGDEAVLTWWLAWLQASGWDW